MRTCPCATPSACPLLFQPHLGHRCWQLQAFIRQAPWQHLQAAEAGHAREGSAQGLGIQMYLITACHIPSQVLQAHQLTERAQVKLSLSLVTA